jgi:hypothetical protein
MWNSWVSNQLGEKQRPASVRTTVKELVTFYEHAPSEVAKEVSKV